MSKFVKEYKTGITRKVVRYFLLPRRIGGRWAWGYTSVEQELVVGYRKKGAREFGEVAPVPHRFWRDMQVV